MSCDFQFFNRSRFENTPLFRLLIGSKTKGWIVISLTPSKPNSLSIKMDCCLGHSFWDISIYRLSNRNYTGQNITINKNSTIFVLLSWTLIKLTTPWIGNVAKILAPSDQNCGLFIKSKFFGQYNFLLLSLYFTLLVLFFWNSIDWLNLHC